MIPAAHIIEWTESAPWLTSKMVEQDLIICRALIAIYSDKFLAKHLAFRGGTALHKLYIHPQPRYSEDIDLVQVHPTGLLSPKVKYNPYEAWKEVHDKLIVKLMK